MTIGQKIKELRTNKGLTQEQLADKLCTTKSAVHNWEREIFEPSLFHCINLADTFNISLDELCCRDFKKR
jgi:transcriptional regulator with XRE-family HTH domain